jgi:3-deoxy-manno-octulosonate cytidylyltransferase (CMP-KDO synthetase)
MKVLGIIPARFGSTRFPGKPLVDIQGKTMVMRVYEQCKKCKDLTEVVVATDDIRILDHVVLNGGKAIMTRTNHESGTSRCAEVAEKFPEMDAIVNIQGDEPFINPEQISELTNLLKGKAEIATLAHRFEDTLSPSNPNLVKVVLDYSNNALYFSRSAIPFIQSPSASQTTYFKHVGIYGYKLSILLQLPHLEPSIIDLGENLEQLRWLFWGFKIRVGISEYKSPSVDVPEDLKNLPIAGNWK